jgi:hypothetical protein
MGFAGFGKMNGWRKNRCLKGTALRAVEKSVVQESMPEGLNRLRKKSLYEGHGFSRAVNFSAMRGFSR